MRQATGAAHAGQAGQVFRTARTVVVDAAVVKEQRILRGTAQRLQHLLNKLRLAACFDACSNVLHTKAARVTRPEVQKKREKEHEGRCGEGRKREADELLRDD